MERTAKSTKILLLGVDGLDPRLTKRYVAQGIMPNVKQYIKRGAQRDDLVMLGGHPTVTPPMWTTMATGCYANVHGITGFQRCGLEIDQVAYNIDSRKCKAEQLWNVTAEAGLKTLVWHWPGSSWPPSSDSENLYVVDGTSPGSVGMAISSVDSEGVLTASVDYTETKFIKAGASEADKACAITDLELDDKVVDDKFAICDTNNSGTVKLLWKESQHEKEAPESDYDHIESTIKDASGWAAAPVDAKEFTLLLSGGLIRRPSLILKNEAGIYDRIAVYKSKKETEPMVVCPLGEMVAEVVDEAYRGTKKFSLVNRNYKLLRLAENGESLTFYISAGMDMTNDSVYSPKKIFREITENVGYPTPTSMLGCQNDMLITECMLPCWEVTLEWQAAALHHLIEKENLDIVFTHFHAVDLEEHQFIRHMADIPINRNPVSMAEKWMENLYMQTDRYLGKFLHFLDEGWTIIIFSDHAQVAAKYGVPMLQSPSSVVIPFMEELGFTLTHKDENGNPIAINWTKTKAIAQREGHIYLNIKGRNKHTLEDGTVLDGIVDAADQWQLEEDIMTGLYQLTSPETGHRIVSVALRNKDAVLLGQGGPDAGDICFWVTEGYNYDHSDCLSTTYGENGTSVSPIFIAAGKGLKKGFTTDRIIRQIDLAPTIAAIAGIRMPAQCEGAPVYQILEEEF